MNLSNNLLCVAIAVFTIVTLQGALGQERIELSADNVTTTTVVPTTDSTTESSSTSSSSSSPTPSTSESSSTSASSSSAASSTSNTTPSSTTSITSSSKSTSTSTASSSSSSSTTMKTTTTAPPALPVVNFTWPKNDSQPACLMVKLSLEMTIGYPLEDKSNGSQKFILQQSDDYTGDCDAKFNQLEVTMTNGWKLVFNYTLDSTDDAKYKLSRLALDYTVTKALFPNVSSDYVGPKTAELANLTEFSTKTGNSYKCNAQTTIMLDSKVTFEISNYQGEPFIPKDKKDKNFDTAVDCPADTTATSKLVPIIVGSTLAVLVVLVLVAYIIGRRKHRPGYQQV